MRVSSGGRKRKWGSCCCCVERERAHPLHSDAFLALSAEPQGVWMHLAFVAMPTPTA